MDCPRLSKMDMVSGLGQNALKFGRVLLLPHLPRPQPSPPIPALPPSPKIVRMTSSCFFDSMLTQIPMGSIMVLL